MRHINQHFTFIQALVFIWSKTPDRHKVLLFITPHTDETHKRAHTHKATTLYSDQKHISHNLPASAAE